MCRRKILFAIVGGLLATHAAYAQDTVTDVGAEKSPMRNDAWWDPSMRSGIGVAFIVGGGATGFTGSTINDVVSSKVGGAWSARVTIGSHIPVGFDVSYVGTAVDLRPIASINTGTLLGTAVEGAVRWNILSHHTWNPYIFVGAGWQHYDITNAMFPVAAFGGSDSDSLAVFPMGGGIAYRDASGITFEARGTFRAASETTFLVRTDGANASFDTWEVSAALGYEL